MPVYQARPRTANLRQTAEAAQRLKLTVRPVPVRDADDIDNAFSVIAKERVGALILVGGAPSFANVEA